MAAYKFAITVRLPSRILCAFIRDRLTDSCVDLRGIITFIFFLKESLVDSRLSSILQIF